MFDAGDCDEFGGAEGPGEMAAAVRELLASCVSAAAGSVQVAATLDASVFDELGSQQQLAELITATEGLRCTLEALEAHLLVQMDASWTRVHTKGLPISRWLATTSRIPAGVAARRLGDAHKLASLPALDAALAHGTVSVEHVRVLLRAVNARNRDAMHAALDALISAAAGMDFDRWRTRVETFAALTDPDGAHNPDDDLPANRLTLSVSDRFMLLRGEIAGEAAINIADTLNALADELFHQHARDHDTCNSAPMPTRAELMALALEELCHRATHTTSNSGSGGSGVRRDATLTLHANLNTDAAANGPGVVATVWAIEHDLLGPLTARDIPTWFCDLDMTAVLIDSLGIPLDTGRTTRRPTRAQKRALRQRDGCCAFPGCNARTDWLDAHHIQPWQHGGPTDLDNLVLLCRHHHRLIHHHGWNIHLDPDSGWTTWTTPDNQHFWGQRHHTQRAGPPPPP